ncbi:MAG: hemolysin family protein [Arcanobacterium sp.]
MAEIKAVPIAILIAGIIVAVIAISGASIILAALQRITRAQAAEAFADGSGGPYIARIVDRRPAAQFITTAIRSVLMLTLGAAAVVLVSLFAHYFWLTMALSIGGALGLVIIAKGLLPSSLGYKYPIGSLRIAGRSLWALTRFGSIFVTRREAAEDIDDTHKEDQLAVMVEHVAESDALEEDERELLQSVFEMSRTIVREVMVPRTDMLSVPEQATLDRALSLFTRSGYSRIPVIGERIDDVTGVIYLKDILRRTFHRSGSLELPVSEVMREPLFVPETKMVDELLNEMRTDSIHIAMVVDEYGGIAGLVTIEDLLEELVGELTDEHDRAEPEVEKIDEGIYRIPARLPIDDLGDLFDIRIDEDDVDSAGGLFAKALGGIPIVGSQTNVHGLHFRSDRFVGRRKRLSTIVVSRPSTSESETDNE